jgi:uncharacterized repeat protein (TIGR03803 family)
MESTAPGWIWRMRFTLVFWLASVLVPAQAQKFKVLHTFKGSDGDGPAAQLVRDSKGNFYGTTISGGTSKCKYKYCGTAFKMDRTGKLVWLHSFLGGNGLQPGSGLFRDASGNLYGTTAYGGKINNHVCSLGCGVAFRLDPTGKETVLHKFTGGVDGYFPVAPLVEDNTRNIYGATNLGGKGLGTVFKLDRTGKETTLYSFPSFSIGAFPVAGVILDSAGSIYGATGYGGAFSCNGSGCGTVYKLDKAGKETVLYNFTGSSDGYFPTSALIWDAAGSLYGTTIDGGNLACQPGIGCGTMFKLSPNSDGSWTETTLYIFCSLSNCTDGRNPSQGPLVRDAAGNLYGTTESGGSCGGSDCGVAFKLDTTGKETVLHSFTGGKDGSRPWAGLTIDNEGILYGTTAAGGDASCNPPIGCGVVFKITP